MCFAVAPFAVVVRVLFSLLLATAAAFCAAQPAQSTAASSHATQPPEIPNPSLLRPASPDSVRAPDLNAPAPATPPPVAPAARPAPSVDIALVLPLASTDYARAAEAVRDGFLAAMDAAGAKERVKVIGHGDGGVLGAFETALSLGARVVVGPLVRDDLRALVSADIELPSTIALNQLDEGAPLPGSVYTLALAIESDARVLARKVREDGYSTIAIIGGTTPLMKRFASAFVGEWLLVGGGAPQSFSFDPTPDGLSKLRRDITRSTAEAALIAIDGPDAALARSFAPRLPAYASALISRETSGASLRDLEEVRLVDVPWLVTPTAPALVNLPRRDYGNPALDRLYALGLDAYRVAHGFLEGVPRRLEFEGATGYLTLSDGHALSREGRLAVVRAGQIVPLGSDR